MEVDMIHFEVRLIFRLLTEKNWEEPWNFPPSEARKIKLKM